jgi:hypothetical protein
MATLHFHQTTTATPQEIVAGVTDFGPGRSEIFENSADDQLQVHHLGATDADVTEGSGGVWERLHYDWSTPDTIVMTTTDSNLWGGRSGHTYTLTPNADGTTDVDAVVIREGKNLKGRALGLVLGSVGKGRLEHAFEDTIKAIEARHEHR